MNMNHPHRTRLRWALAGAVLATAVGTSQLAFTSLASAAPTSVVMPSGTTLIAPPPVPYEPDPYETPSGEAPPVLSPSSLTVSAGVGVSLTASLTVSSTHSATVTYSVTDPGKLPPGVTIDATGKISGTPTTVGIYAVPVKACAGDICSTATVTITVVKSTTTTINFTIVLQGYQAAPGKPATGKLVVEGPSATQVTLTVADPGKVPPGMTIAPDGTIGGTPTTPGSYVVPFKVCLGTTCGETTVTLVVTAAPVGTSITVTSTSTIKLVTGKPVTGQVSFPHLPGTLTYTVTDPSKVPPGLTITTTGAISGTPTTPGTYVIPVRVTDTAGSKAEFTITLSVSACTGANRVALGC